MKNEEKFIGTHSQTQTTCTCNYAPPCCLLMLVEFARSLFPWQINKTNKSHACFMQRISYYSKIHFFKTTPHSQSQKRQPKKKKNPTPKYLHYTRVFFFGYQIILWIFPEISKFTWIWTRKKKTPQQLSDKNV